MRLISAELLKLRTTSLWWIFSIILLPLYGISLTWNWVIGDAQLTNDFGDGVPIADVAGVASSLYTSGQFFGILLVVLLSAMLVTNEFFHLTATATFLTTPRRERVILAKMAVAVVVALVVWAFTTLLNLIFAPLALSGMGKSAYLGAGFVWQSIGLNGLAFVLWALLGVGTGVLIRSQIGATVTLAILYVIGAQVLEGLIVLLAGLYNEAILPFRVLIPTLAANLMATGPQLDNDPPRWVGAVIMLAYAGLFSVIGTAITKHRDIG